MKFDVVSGDIENTKADVWVVGVHEDDTKSKTLKRLDEVSAGLVSAVLKNGEFTGAAGENCLLHGQIGKTTQRLLLWGLGKKGGLSLKKIYNATAKIARFAQTKHLKSFALQLMISDDGDDAYTDIVSTHVSAIAHGHYEFSKYKTAAKKKTQLDKITLVLGDADKKSAKGAVDAAAVVVEAQNNVRNLMNEPANVVTPKALADYAKKLAKKTGMKCTVYGEKQLKKMGFNALLGVGQGSTNESHFIVLEYGAQHKKKGTVCVVGKGVTFDSGGVSIKPSSKMEDMKFDMGGAAATLGTMESVARLKPKVHVYGLVPTVENMCGGNAQRPGDIVMSHSGKSVEIINTDAEGRLILADALSYATTLKPDVIIDIATLTGGVVVALGSYASGLFGNDELMTYKMIEASEQVVEPMWHLPAWDEYQDDLKSNYADIKNMGHGREASPIVAAMFLKFFVGDCKWLHLDIAGTGWNERFGTATKGGTGAGVRAITRFIMDWKK